jgi:molybdate transport system substrate-binding protein
MRVMRVARQSRPRTATLLTVVAAVLILASGVCRAEPNAAITVFAAASMSDVLQKLAGRYAERSADAVRFSFAASSALARQIEAGAPADIFVSASPEWVDDLAARHLIEPGSVISPIGNTLVLIAPAAAAAHTVVIGKDIDLVAMLGNGGRLAIGDPDYVPAGTYARQSLRHLGVWPGLEPRLARTDTVRAALTLVERGEVPLGIVYATDAIVSARVSIIGRFPPESHDGIVYPFAIVAGRGEPGVSRFFAFLTGAEAAAVYEAFGFTLRSWPMQGGG